MKQNSPHDTAAITLSHATVEDAADVHRLVIELAKVQGAGDLVRSSPADLARDGLKPGAMLQAVLARDAAGKAVGLSLYFFTYSTWNGQRVLYVEDLYVDAALRGSGLGRRLLAEMARITKAEGALRLDLSVKSGNTARGFYETLGLVQKGDWVPYTLTGDALEALAES
jgi:GNAT superfamily N-acetyltransferase